MDPYAVLQVPPEADADAIKKAYRKLARQWHPDVNASPEAAERFKEVAAAFEILGDPVRRSAHDAAAGRVARGELPSEFLDHVTSAIERAQTFAERVVLPHYARYWRGHGAELAARLWRDLDELPDLQGTGQPTWLSRDIHVSMSTAPSGSLSSLYPAPGGHWQIVLTPWALHRAGFTQPAEIDDAILKVLLARYAQVLATGRFLPPVDPSDWDRAIAEARAHDTRVLTELWGQRVFWGVVAGLVMLLLYSGFMGW